MRLFSLPDGKIDYRDGVLWMTAPFEFRTNGPPPGPRTATPKWLPPKRRPKPIKIWR